MGGFRPNVGMSWRHVRSRVRTWGVLPNVRLPCPHVAPALPVATELKKNILESCDKEVAARSIGERVMNYLRNLDPVAYVRFASVYKQFQDVEEFLKDLTDSENTNGVSEENTSA